MQERWQSGEVPNWRSCIRPYIPKLKLLINCIIEESEVEVFPPRATAGAQPSRVTRPVTLERGSSPSSLAIARPGPFFFCT